MSTHLFTLWRLLCGESLAKDGEIPSLLKYILTIQSSLGFLLHKNSEYYLNLEKKAKQMKGGFLLMQMQRQFCLSLYSQPVAFVPDAYTHFGTLTTFLFSLSGSSCQDGPTGSYQSHGSY